MKKKILFLVGTLQSGGVSKSVVNLLNAVDRSTYDVHLLLLCRDGDVFSPYLPKDIHLHVDDRIEALHQGFHGLIRLLLKGQALLAFGSLVRMVLSRVSRSAAGRWLARLMPVFTDEEFDLIVDYGGQQQLYYMVDKLCGKHKVTFFHNDYSKWPYYYKADKLYYPRVDHIFSVSPVCVDVLKRYFPECADKISLMENLSSPGVIQRLAGESVSIPYAKVLFCTLGHFCRRKGSDMAIEAAAILKKRGMEFKWMFVGKVLERDLVALAEAKGVRDNLVFMGIQSNPYPFVKSADIYVHTSRFEGKSMALDEAKILCKPIVVTNFSTVRDQFEDGVNASVCEMDGEKLADAISDLCENRGLREKYVSYLQDHITDNSCEVNKLYELMS